MLLKYIGGANVIMGSFVISIFALFTFGPSELFRFPDQTNLIIAGIALMGVANSGFFVAALSLIIKIMKNNLNL